MIENKVEKGGKVNFCLPTTLSVLSRTTFEETILVPGATGVTVP